MRKVVGFRVSAHTLAVRVHWLRRAVGAGLLPLLHELEQKEFQVIATRRVIARVSSCQQVVARWSPEWSPVVTRVVASDRQSGRQWSPGMYQFIRYF